jgi:hypothetical protein
MRSFAAIHYTEGMEPGVFRKKDQKLLGAATVALDMAVQGAVA